MDGIGVGRSGGCGKRVEEGFGVWKDGVEGLKGMVGEWGGQVQGLVNGPVGEWVSGPVIVSGLMLSHVRPLRACSIINRQQIH